jgi:hypothetical protein
MAKPHLHSTEERQQQGKAMRDKYPRASHGEVILGQGGQRDVVALIEDSNKDRLQNRHGRMAQSVFGSRCP